MDNAQEVVAREVENSLGALTKNIDETCNSLSQTAVTMQKRAESSRRWDLFMRSTTAVLAVGSPLLVTYATTPNVADIYKLIAILLSAVAGAATTLQAIFGLRQSYVRNANSALSLRQIVRDLRSRTQAASFKPDIYSPGKVMSELDKANVNASEVIAFAEKSKIADYGTGS